MSNTRIQIGQLASTIRDCIEGYTDEMALGTKEAVQKVGKEGAKMLKANSPKRHSSGGRPGAYAKGWRFKVQNESADKIEGVLYNATNPGLPHLLEFGHALRQGGRSPAISHIAPVEQYCTEQLEKEIESISQ